MDFCYKEVLLYIKVTLYVFWLVLHPLFFMQLDNPKIINSVLKNDIASWRILPEKLKNGIKIWKGQTVLELSKQYLLCFDQLLLKNCLADCNFDTILGVFQTFCFRVFILIVHNFNIAHKTCSINMKFKLFYCFCWLGERKVYNRSHQCSRTMVEIQRSSG